MNPTIIWSSVNCLILLYKWKPCLDRWMRDWNISSLDSSGLLIHSLDDKVCVAINSILVMSNDKTFQSCLLFHPCLLSGHESTTSHLKMWLKCHQQTTLEKMLLLSLHQVDQESALHWLQPWCQDGWGGGRQLWICLCQSEQAWATEIRVVKWCLLLLK